MDGYIMEVTQTQEELIELIKKDEELMEIISHTFLSYFPAGSTNPVTNESIVERDDERRLLYQLVYKRSSLNKEKLYILVKKEFNI